jgi:hypothetical protein
LRVTLPRLAWAEEQGTFPLVSDADGIENLVVTRWVAPRTPPREWRNAIARPGATKGAWRAQLAARPRAIKYPIK